MWGQSFKARCILNNKFREHRLFIIVVTNRYANTSESRRDDPDAAEPTYPSKIKHSAAGKQAVEGRLRDGDIVEFEFLQPREAMCAGSINLGKITATDAGNVQRVSEAEHGRRQRARMSGMKAELLEPIQG